MAVFIETCKVLFLTTFYQMDKFVVRTHLLTLTLSESDVSSFRTDRSHRKKAEMGSAGLHSSLCLTLWLNIDNHRRSVATATELIIHAKQHPEKLTFKSKLTELPALTKLTASMQRQKYHHHHQLCSLIGQSAGTCDLRSAPEPRPVSTTARYLNFLSPVVPASVAYAVIS